MKKWTVAFLIVCLVFVAGARRPSPVKQLREMQKTINRLEQEVEYNLECIKVLMEKNGLECPSREELVIDIPARPTYASGFLRPSEMKAGQRGKFTKTIIEHIFDNGDAIVIVATWPERITCYLSKFPTEGLADDIEFDAENKIEYFIKGPRKYYSVNGSGTTLMEIIPVTAEHIIKEHLKNSVQTHK